MINMYRGVILILLNEFHSIIAVTNTHIQSSNQQKNLNTQFINFCSLLLEIALTLFFLSCLVFGVVFITIFLIPSYLLYTVQQLLLFFVEKVTQVFRDESTATVLNIKEPVLDNSLITPDTNLKEKK